MKEERRGDFGAFNRIARLRVANLLNHSKKKTLKFFLGVGRGEENMVPFLLPSDSVSENVLLTFQKFATKGSYFLKQSEDQRNKVKIKIAENNLLLCTHFSLVFSSKNKKKEYDENTNPIHHYRI